MLRPGQILSTYLHLAPDIEQTEDLVTSRSFCIAYETVTSNNGSLPLLTPMSEVAGGLRRRLAHTVWKGARGPRHSARRRARGPAAEVVILGGGVSGSHAATIAVGMGANVTVVDRSADTFKRLAAQFGPSIATVFSSQVTSTM